MFVFHSANSPAVSNVSLSSETYIDAVFAPSFRCAIPIPRQRSLAHQGILKNIYFIPQPHINREKERKTNSTILKTNPSSSLPMVFYVLRLIIQGSKTSYVNFFIALIWMVYTHAILTLMVTYSVVMPFVFCNASWNAYGCSQQAYTINVFWPPVFIAYLCQNISEISLLTAKQMLRPLYLLLCTRENNDLMRLKMILKGTIGFCF